MYVVLDEISPLQRYSIINQAIAPRVVAWISSVSQKGVINLAPYDFFAPLSSDPVIFALSFFPKSNGSLKDTLKNIMGEKKASICMCDLALLEKMHKTSQELESEVSESDIFDIPMEVKAQNYPPIPKGVKVAFMCDLYDCFELGRSNKVALLQARECFIEDGILDSHLNIDVHHIARAGKSYQISDRTLPLQELDKQNMR